MNLGDCTIGSSKKGEVSVRNLSEMPCSVALRFSSKILQVVEPKAPDGRVVIPPMSHFNFVLEIVPMRINPGYLKQITVVNYTNRSNDMFVKLRSNNVDSNRVSLHALYYTVRSEHPSNTVSFETIVTNSPMLRTFSIKNVTQAGIVLELWPALADSMKIYCERERSARKGADEGKTGEGSESHGQQQQQQQQQLRAAKKPGMTTSSVKGKQQQQNNANSLIGPPSDGYAKKNAGGGAGVGGGGGGGGSGAGGGQRVVKDLSSAMPDHLLFDLDSLGSEVCDRNLQPSTPENHNQNPNIWVPKP